jgi:hypothetical protein
LLGSNDHQFMAIYQDAMAEVSNWRERVKGTPPFFEIQRLSMAAFLTVFLLFSAALGIDLIPGFSWGVWGWFKDEF